MKYSLESKATDVGREDKKIPDAFFTLLRRTNSNLIYRCCCVSPMSYLQHLV